METEDIKKCHVENFLKLTSDRIHGLESETPK